jgi:hypothetical protein
MKKPFANVLLSMQPALLLLWAVGSVLLFVAAISSLWGWDVVAWISNLLMLGTIWDERETFRNALARRLGKGDRWIALVYSAMALAATLINIGHLLARSVLGWHCCTL